MTVWSKVNSSHLVIFHCLFHWLIVVPTADREQDAMDYGPDVPPRHPSGETEEGKLDCVCALFV